MLSSLFRLFFVFVWIRRLFWLLSLPFRIVMTMVSDVRKFCGFIVRLFTPSFWSSVYAWTCSDEAVSLGKRIVLVVFVLFLGLGALVVVAGIRQAGHARGGEALAASPTPPGDHKEPEVRRAIPVASPSVQRPGETLYLVVGVARGDFLNVHSRASASSAVVARLPNGYDGVQIVGEPVMNDTTQWVQVHFGDHTGWVSRVYLKPDQTQPGKSWSNLLPGTQVYRSTAFSIR